MLEFSKKYFQDFLNILDRRNKVLESQGGCTRRGPPTLSAEEVVSRSGLGAGVVTSFLFESYLEFVAEESVADAAAAAENFSDAVHMLSEASSGIGLFGACLHFL